MLVASSLYEAQKLANSISSILDSNDVLLFPSDELIHAQHLASSKELISERLFVLNRLLDDSKKIVIVHPTSISRFLPSPKLFKEYSYKLKIGDKIDTKKILDKLIRSGYYRVNKIDRSLQVAKRGDIVDIFSINYNSPIRLSLFDDEIESITFFSLTNYESIKKVNEVTILPATDQLFSDREFDNIETKLLNQAIKDKDIVGEELSNNLVSNITSDIDNYENYNFLERLYRYYGFLQDSNYSIFDYFKADLVFYSNYNEFKNNYENLYKESRTFLDSLLLNGQCISHQELYFDLAKLINSKKIITTKSYKETDNDVLVNVKNIVTIIDNNDPIMGTIISYIKKGDKIVISLPNISQKNMVIEALNNSHIDYEKTVGLNVPTKNISISIFGLSEGFELVDENVAFITAKELFNYNVHNSRFASHFQEAISIHSYDELKPGDYIVHEYHGIGKFVDVVTKKINDVHRDFLLINYADDAQLYVPLSQFSLIRKYSGREGYVPTLSSLNSKAWDKKKEKIRNRLDELTKKLATLYNERALMKGYAFPKDDFLQIKFNNDFPHELTSDQVEAYNSISKDMEALYPMDRLLCGDVGYGKTEVAFRAIFKCINSHKQAAMLCPTTLLCRQHYELAKQRFTNYGVNIAVFSRLVPLSIQNKYIEEIKEGKIHLVIGTHRLLSKDIKFNDLGLLVVDEEQRFGVLQKERIKEIKKDVDVLSLSATPIPRTLQMSLVGIHSLSQINTAPLLRNAIQTYVTPYNTTIIKEIINRELSRDGQVFYLHNNVASIDFKAQYLKELIPNSKIGVVHGKMDKTQIENVMMKFYNGEINLLVATTIIENGLDVPNANLIIVENADLFGLAQLYQIKGRVGRSDRLAYAYFLYDPQKTISEDGQKRLKAIQEFAELGSGYKIAQRDLMIRGAGDILGKEQSGFIDSIGIDLYLKLLNESVKKQKNEDLFEHKIVGNINLDAYLPDSYIDKSEKIKLYQEIEDAKTDIDLEKLKNRFLDIYGRIPIEVIKLLEKKRIDNALSGEEFTKITEEFDSIFVFLSPYFGGIDGIGIKLFDALVDYIKKIKINLNYKDRVFIIRFEKEGNYLKLIKDVADKIHELYVELKSRKNNAS